MCRNTYALQIEITTRTNFVAAVAGDNWPVSCHHPPRRMIMIGPLSVAKVMWLHPPSLLPQRRPLLTMTAVRFGKTATTHTSSLNPLQARLRGSCSSLRLVPAIDRATARSLAHQSHHSLHLSTNESPSRRTALRYPIFFWSFSSMGI
jgi:hypothetical protein